MGLAQAAAAECALCDDLIELDAAGVACMAASLPQTAFPADGSPVLVDLGPCLGQTGGAERGGLATMPSYKDMLRQAQAPQVPAVPVVRKSAFLLDASWGACVLDLLKRPLPATGDLLALDLLDQCP